MRKANKWTQGPTELAIPALPADYAGILGCRFERATFDPKVGPEVFAMILEEPEYARRLAMTRPFNLLSRQGLLRTANGVVAFIVRTIAAEPERNSS